MIDNITPVVVEPCDFNCGHKLIELSVVVDVFESDVETIEYILGHKIESIRFVDDIVAYELILHLLTDAESPEDIDAASVNVLCDFLIDDQIDRLIKVIEPLYGITYE
jgi:hypothetical protein